jgi:cytokinesis protein
LIKSEILMAGSSAKSFKAPERLSEAIANFNNELCSETFLRELQGVLPNDDDVRNFSFLYPGMIYR